MLVETSVGEAIITRVDFISAEKAVVTAMCGDGIRKQIVSYEEGMRVQRELTEDED
jgi:hypothetical protein